MTGIMSEADADALPLDLETMYAAADRVLARGAEPLSDEDLETLRLQLRGHIQLLAPEVEAAARKLDEDGALRYSALGCVWEARSRFQAEPSPRYGGPAGHARRLARVLNALCDQHETLGGGVS